MRRAVLLLAAMVVTVFSVFVAAPAANANPWGPYGWRPLHTSNQCVHAEGGSNPGAYIKLWPCNGNSASYPANLRWWSYQLSGNIFVFKSHGDRSLCMDGYYGAGKSIQLFDCDDSLEQRWEGINHGGGRYSFRNQRHRSQCIDVLRGGTGTGTPVILYACNYDSNQRFQLH